MTKKVDPIDRKNRIVEAAFQVIYQSGFEKTTLRKIAQNAGLSLGSVQYFFPKQKDIYLFAMDVIYQKFEERMRNVEQPEEGIFEYAVRMVKQIVQVGTKEERIENDIWVKFSLMAVMNSDYQGRKDEFREINIAFAKEILEMLQDNNYLDKHTNIEDSAISLTVFVHGLVFESVIYTHLYNDQVVEKEVRAYLRKVCY